METMENRQNDLSLKTGVKFLDAQQMNNTFPDFLALYNRLISQRRIASLYAEQSKASTQIDRDYDNVFAVLGGRGTGKTSVLTTLREKLLAENKHHDIVLNIITLEMIPDDHCSILAWVLSMMGKEVNRLLDIVKSSTYSTNNFEFQPLNDYYHFFRNCRYQENNRLNTEYNRLLSIAFAMTESLASSDEFSQIMMHRSQQYYQFSEELNRFWDNLVEVQKHCCSINAKNEYKPQSNEPLIFLLFDDIDLAPQRSMELLTSTFHFFSNSNIVILLSAAESVLKKAITQSTSDKIRGSFQCGHLHQSMPFNGHAEQNESDFYTQTDIHKMVSEFYNKVIPITNRFFLKKQRTIEAKASYQYSTAPQSFHYKNEVRSVNIMDMLDSEIERMVLVGKRTNPNARNFLRRREFDSLEETSGLYPIYLIVFGNKNRNLANLCLEIILMRHRLLDFSDTLSENSLESSKRHALQNILFHLMRSIFVAQKNISEYQCYTEELLIDQYESQRLFVNYDFVLALYDKEVEHLRFEADKQFGRFDTINNEEWNSVTTSIHERYITEELRKIKSKMISVLFLLMWTESVLAIFDITRTKTHGASRIVYLLNRNTNAHLRSARFNIRLLPNISSEIELYNYFSRIIAHSDQYISFDFYDETQVKRYLVDWWQSIYDSIHSNRDSFDPEIASATMCNYLTTKLKTDPLWVRTALGLIFIRRSQINIVSKEILRNIETSLQSLEWYYFLNPLTNAKNESLALFLSQDDIVEYSKSKFSKWEALYSSSFREFIKAPELAQNDLKSILKVNLRKATICKTLNESCNTFQKKFTTDQTAYKENNNENSHSLKSAILYYLSQKAQNYATPYFGNLSLSKSALSRHLPLSDPQIFTAFTEETLNDIHAFLENTTIQLAFTAETLLAFQKDLETCKVFTTKTATIRENLISFVQEILDDHISNKSNVATANILIPSNPFITFFQALKNYCNALNDTSSGDIFFYKTETLETMSTIIRHLHFYVDNKTSNDILYTHSNIYGDFALHENLTNNEFLDEFSSLESFLLDQQVFQTLVPYYFAAKLLSQKNVTIDPSRVSDKNFTDSVNQLYQRIQANPKNRFLLLKKALNQTKTIIVHDYIDMLRNTNE